MKILLVAAPELTPQAPGLELLGRCESSQLVHDAQRLGPDAIVIVRARADEASLLASAELDAGNGPPVAMFVSDADSGLMERALRSGVHAYVVDGWSDSRLPAVLQLAQLRARLERRQRDEFQALAARFEERKLVDRAKGILMRARQITEDEAFRVLRTASMHGQQRVGELSQQLITTASHAESINQAGQLRMLSQRIVKLQAQVFLRVAVADSQARLADSRRRADGLLAGLRTALPRAAFGGPLRSVAAAWRDLRAELDGQADAARLRAADAAAERLLAAAERLTDSLALSGLAKSLHVVNLCGRQRMLSQRLAKQALLAQAMPPPQPAAAEAAALLLVQTEQAFSEALRTLRELPLSTPEIRRTLDAAGACWSGLCAGVAGAPSAAGQRRLADASEDVLDLFEQLTERYERSMQVLMG